MDSKDREESIELDREATMPQLASRQYGRTQTLDRVAHRTLERTHSISFATPTRVDPRTRLPINFRTLSNELSIAHLSAPEKGGKRAVKELSELVWHTLSADELCTRLGVAPNSGLDTAMAERRLASDGPNAISKPPRNLPKKIFWYIFGGFGSLLFAASIVCFLAWKPLGNPAPQVSNLALAVVLLIVIALQAGFNAYQDYSTGRVMASISGMLPADVLVKRDGSFKTMPATQLVSGDIVKLTLGVKVPADLRILEHSSDLRFDRSILTGESKPVAASVDSTDKNYMETRNIALQGTLCTEGSGIGICVGLGDATVFGRISKEATRERPLPTTLELEISRFIIIIASLAASVAVLIVILWAAWLRRSHPGFINVSALLVDCVSVAVAFIPEGLPVCVTLSLTIIANSMKKKSILCKSLSTVESLGCVNTGTLTQNRMTVVNVVVGLVAQTASKARDLIAVGGPEGSVVASLAAIAGLCNDAMFEQCSPDTPVENRVVNGDATDTGLLRFAENASSVSWLRSRWQERAKVSFNSKNKFALKLLSPVAPSAESFEKDTLLGPDDVLTEQGLMMVIKGAPDVLIRRCAAFVNSNGTHSVLDDDAIRTLSERQSDLASQGQRVLLLAKKVVTAKQVEEAGQDEDRLVSLAMGLVIVGLTALVDPPREDTKETVRVCRRAGIRFMMVTGDFALTAASIAAQCGIITNLKTVQHLADLSRDDIATDEKPLDDDEERIPRALVLSGTDIQQMSDAQWTQALQFEEVVFARTSPQQKLQIVKAYQGNGCTVAVTGDGVNDAPALRQADVGVAVAGGSEVALEAADLVLLGDFSAIVVGIESGRLCFENLRATLLYLLPAGSFSELMPVLLNVFFGLPQALSNIQMILICAVTDVMPALSLCFEKPEADLLLRKPRNRRTEHLVDWKLMLHAYFFLGIIESLTACTGAFYFGFAKNGIPFSSLWLKYGEFGLDPDVLKHATDKAQSIYFFNLVLMQWFNLLATRTRRLSIFQQPPIGSPRTQNLYLFPAMLFALVFAIFFSYIPWFQKIFGTHTIAAEYFFLPLAYGVVVLFLDEARKYWARRSPSSVIAKIAW